MKPKADRIAGEVALHFEGNEVPGDEFVNRINHFYALLNTVVDASSGTRKAARWSIKMERGSTVAVFKAAPQAANTITIRRGISNVYRGLSALEAGRIDVPESFTETALKHAQKFAQSGPIATDRKHSKLTIRKGATQKLRVSSRFNDTINEILAPADNSLGTLAGTIKLVNGHDGFHAHLFLDADDRLVPCTFPESLKDRFHKAWLKRVLIYGKIERRRDGVPVKITSLDLSQKGDPLSWDEIQSLRGVYRQ